MTTWRSKIVAQYVVADIVSDIPKLPFEPVSPHTWSAIQKAELDREFGVSDKTKWQEADYPISPTERQMLKDFDVDAIERVGYIAHLLETHFPHQYANLIDYDAGKVTIVKPLKIAVAARPGVFVDLDGVLCDFVRAYRDVWGDPGTGYFPSITESPKGWWANMPWMPDGQTLWRFVAPLRPTILTAPSRDPECEPGKREWVRRELGGVPVIVDGAKSRYAEPSAILIDDMPYNIEPWRREGGIGILHRSARATIQELKRILS